MFSTLGFCDTYATSDLRDNSKEYIDINSIERNVFLPLRKKLEDLHRNIPMKIKSISILNPQIFLILIMPVLY